MRVESYELKFGANQIVTRGENGKPLAVRNKGHRLYLDVLTQGELEPDSKVAIEWTVFVAGGESGLAWTHLISGKEQYLGSGTLRLKYRILNLFPVIIPAHVFGRPTSLIALDEQEDHAKRSRVTERGSAESPQIQVLPGDVIGIRSSSKGDRLANAMKAVEEAYYPVFGSMGDHHRDAYEPEISTPEQFEEREQLLTENLRVKKPTKTGKRTTKK